MASVDTASFPPSWKSIADAVGHCMLVFTYAPALLAVPSWLWFEFNNPANLQLSVVLAFAPIRGFLLLLDRFQAGAPAGVLAGCLQGLLLIVWRSMHANPVMRWQRFALGAVSGASAAGLVVILVVLIPALRGGASAPVPEVTSAIASGLACGLLSTATALRLLTGTSNLETAARAAT